MKETWNVIKRILNKNKKSTTINTIQHAGKTVTDSTEIANVFNNFHQCRGKSCYKNPLCW